MDVKDPNSCQIICCTNEAMYMLYRKDATQSPMQICTEHAQAIDDVMNQPAPRKTAVERYK